MTATRSGMRKTRLTEVQVTRRQASSGPIPVNSTRAIASGVVYWSNQGAARELFVPVKSSEISGKKVPQAITMVIPTNNRLLTRKTDSRDNNESIRFSSERRSSRRETIRKVEPMTMIPITEIEKPIDLMMRIKLDDKLVEQYAAQMKAGAIFPPIAITRVDGELYLTDGYHRTNARQKLGDTVIEAIIVDGTYEDAQDAAVASVRANSYGGRKHVDAEKRKAVLTVLSMPRHQAKTDGDVANLVGVNRELIRRLRHATCDNSKLQSDNSSAPSPKKKIGKDGKRRPSTYKKRKPPQLPAPVRRPPSISANKLTQEQFEEARRHDHRHVYLRPISEEILDKNQRAVRTFSAAARDLGLAAVAFHKAIEDAGFERYGFKDDRQPFTVTQYLDTLATMQNGGHTWFDKLSRHMDALMAAFRLLEPFATPPKKDQS